MDSIDISVSIKVRAVRHDDGVVYGERLIPASPARAVGVGRRVVELPAVLEYWIPFAVYESEFATWLTSSEESA